MKKPFNKLRVAIFYDWLDRWGGAEKVLLNIISLFPKAHLFCLFSDSQKIDWLPKNKIINSFIQKLSPSPIFSPVYDLAAEKLDFSSYDLIISTTTNVGHCLITPANSLFVCYYHNLNRHLYLKPQSILQPLLNFYKKIDLIYSQRPDFSFCNSVNVQSRLKKFLKIDSQIIYPGIDTSVFKPISKPTNDYFLIVSRLVPHKKIDYVINTFKNISYPIKIVGTGRDYYRLKTISQNKKNISFLGSVNNRQLLDLYQNCTALICPQLEDFGLTSVEAQACSRPVIGYAAGGNLETIINLKTGVLYPEQNSASLLASINKLNKIKIDPNNCRLQALKFSQETFMLNFKKQLEDLWQKKITI
jgi:glycosyltransferase involved in cell wall biosynthesis